MKPAKRNLRDAVRLYDALQECYDRSDRLCLQKHSRGLYSVNDEINAALTVLGDEIIDLAREATKGADHGRT